MMDMIASTTPRQLRKRLGLTLAAAMANPLAFVLDRARSIGVVAMALVLLPIAAHAQTVSGGASPATMVNNVCTFILGTFGQSVAVLAIIGIGFLWMFGRASLGVIAGIVGGIVIMFGASYLGQTLTGG
jgi:type IV secretory pathway VirB2 component (pilin)